MKTNPSRVLTAMLLASLAGNGILYHRLSGSLKEARTFRELLTTQATNAQPESWVAPLVRPIAPQP